jgi:hypothetical protein
MPARGGAAARRGGASPVDRTVISLDPPPAQSEIVDPAVHIEVSLAPAGEQHEAEVTWGDFLAALPAALAMHPEHRSAPAAEQRRHAVRRRALQKTAALPRAYMAARAGARRARSATPGKRRASQEGMIGPRGAASLHASLATADRWLLAGLMLTSSVLVAVLTSALTVRGMQPAAHIASPVIASRAEPVLVTAAKPVLATRDSAASEMAAHVDSSRNRVEASGAAAATPARARPSPKRVAPREERRSVSLAEHTRASLPAFIVHTAPAATPSGEPEPRLATVPSITAPPTASPLANPAVLEELRAIHAEIDARKRHMDSLTAALDSLNRAPGPH